MITMIEKIKQHAHKKLKHCPYCIQHDQDFIDKYSLHELSVFSSSPAFCFNGRWYHLQLSAPEPNSRGGYNWQECLAAEHQEYLAIADGKIFSITDAEEYVKSKLQKR